MIMWSLILAALAIGLAALLTLFHLTNPYAKTTIFQAPYRTSVNRRGIIEYHELYRLKVYTGPLANVLGYVKSGFLIVQNTFFGSKRAQGGDASAIIDHIHQLRFDPKHPYLISGDQFSVLYPRNLGVFYNQLLDPNTAHSQQDWEGRQRIYLQSVLVAIDGLSAATDPRTTIVPMGPRHAVLTQVHPGGTGSDQVYGLLYALDQLLQPAVSDDGQYKRRTSQAAQRVLRERRKQLQHIYDTYVRTVYEPVTELVRSDLHLASARDGVIRASSFYDNIILYETIRLAQKLGLKDDLSIDVKAMERRIKETYWNDEAGYFNDDLRNPHFSSDWLIGYVTGFFDLTDATDLQRTRRIIKYVEQAGLAEPFPIKYQIPHDNNRVPYFVRRFVPNYGSDVIWSYWGAQYITLLLAMYRQTGTKQYNKLAGVYIDRYLECIVRDGGFAETFDANGAFLHTGVYKSIRLTGWVVQFEHALYAYRQTSSPSEKGLKS